MDKGVCMKKNITKNKIVKNIPLAEMLSLVLHHPDMPEPLHDGIRDAITNLFNAHVDQDEIAEFERSPTYLEMIIRGYKKEAAGTLAEGQWPEVVK